MLFRAASLLLMAGWLKEEKRWGRGEREGGVDNTHTSFVQIHQILETLKTERVRGQCATMRIATPWTQTGRKEQKLHKK